MIRRIIRIDEEKCIGCGACAEACHEGAIEMVDGKAKLARENYCDGLGDCLPECPTNAITFEEREAPEYDEAAVAASKQAKAEHPHGHHGHHSHHDQHGHHGGACPGSQMRTMKRESTDAAAAATASAAASQLAQWPCQIKLVPVNAPYFEGAELLVAADCTAYAYANFHAEFMSGKITLIGCPKLDMADYSEKLTAIIKGNDIKSVTVLRMEVPCCGGIEAAAKEALRNSGKSLPIRVVTIAIDGGILSDRNN